MAHQSAEIEFRWSAAKMPAVTTNLKRLSGELWRFPLTIRARQVIANDLRFHLLAASRDIHSE